MKVLEHVAAGQSRFNVPGIACDARGVAIGRLVTVLLPSIDRAVALFRGLSERISLDDLLPESRISRVVARAGAQELLVRLPASSSHVADTCAAVARLTGGLVFTGTSRHFVAYRDANSPLGYDVESLFAGGDDFVLYAREFVQSYRSVGDIQLSRLLLDLALQRKRDDWPEARERVLLRLERGIWPAVVTYLHRNGVACGVAAGARSDTAASSEQSALHLVSADRLPERMLRLFRGLPGVEIYRMHGERAAIEVGFEHPLVLESCDSLLAEHALYLFSGTRGQLEVLAEAPQFVPARALVGLHTPPREESAVSLSSSDVEQLRVQIRLVPSGPVHRPVVATRISREDAERFKKLVYLLPPNVLAACRVCVTADDIYLYALDGLDYLPLGELYWAAAPRVFVPLGYQLIPAIGGDLLLEHLEAGQDDLFFWQRRASEVHRLTLEHFSPLGRVAVADLPISGPAEVVAAQAVGDPGASLVNDDAGVFPLWGFVDEQ